MLNMKKGLAIVLAAATAFTFAPVSMLGNPVVAEAATADITSANLTTTTLAGTTASDFTVATKKGNADETIGTAGDVTLKIYSDASAATDVTSDFTLGQSTVANPSIISVQIRTAVTETKTYYAQATVNGVKSAVKPFLVYKDATAATAVDKVNAIPTGTANTYDVYVQAGQTYDIVNGDTTVGGLKTSDNDYQWFAGTTSNFTTAIDPAADTADGIAAVSNKPGKGLTITAAGQADSDVNGTTLYLKTGTASAGSITGVSSEITVRVHVYKNKGTLTLGDSQFSVMKNAAGNMASEINLAESGNTYVLNKGNIVSSESGNFTFGQAYITGENSVSLATPSVATSNSTWNVTGSEIGSFNVTFQIGYVYKKSFEYASVSTVVNVKDATDLVKVIDANGNEISYTGAATTDVQKAGINLVKGQTFDLGALTGVYNGAVKVNDATFSFESNSAAVTIDKDGKGILTGAAKASGAIVTITAKEGSLELTKAHVLVNVNDLASDELTVKDAAGNTYTNVPQYFTYTNNSGSPVTVNLTDTKVANNALYNYFNNVVKAKDSKISYATIDLVDNKSVTLTATSANGNSMPSPVIANTQSATVNAGVVTTHPTDTVVTSGLAGGKITLTAKSAGYAVIKFTSQDSAKATGGTAYVFVRVLATPEAAIYGLESTYNLAYGNYVDYTSGTRHESQYSLDLEKKFTTNGGTPSYKLMSKSDYPSDDPTAVKVNNYGIVTAYKAGATAHIKVSVANSDNTSETSKIVEIKTVEPKQNKLTVSVVSGSAIDATLTIDSVTNLTVSADYQEKGIKVITGNANQDAAVLATTDYINTITLYPNKEGNAKITVEAAGDGETVAPAQKQIIVTYTVKTPAKVSGLKIKNKKGAAVTVTFKKDSTDKNMKYYVQKKIGSKTSGKSVASTKTTLSVKKGATVKVRVKAYYYDASGKKHVGKYSAWKTLKTDKK